MKKSHNLKVFMVTMFLGGAAPVLVADPIDLDPFPNENLTYFVPINPCRLFDTRFIPTEVVDPDTGETITELLPEPFPAGITERTFGVWGSDLEFQGGKTGPEDCTLSVPNTAISVHINLTVTEPAGKGFLRGWAGGPEAIESTSTLMNWDKVKASNATALIFNNSPDPEDIVIKVFTTGTMHLIGDAVGYYLPVRSQAQAEGAAIATTSSLDSRTRPRP